MKDNEEKNTDDLLGSFLNVLRKNEPELTDDVEIPDTVMQSIKDLPQFIPQGETSQSSPIRYLTYAQRWLTAASVCLLILYGVEEFTIVQKMNTLEAHAASFNVEPSSTRYRRLAKNLFTVQSLQQRFPGRLKFFPAKQYLSQSQTNQSFKSLKP
ncbi:hypothetical protein ACFLS7_04210 [Bacteroidota bacterium]